MHLVSVALHGFIMLPKVPFSHKTFAVSAHLSPSCLVVLLQAVPHLIAQLLMGELRNRVRLGSYPPCSAKASDTFSKSTSHEDGFGDFLPFSTPDFLTSLLRMA